MMARFSGIFRKLKPAEYNKYPFMLGVKKSDEPCFNPIYIFGKSSFVDRAFITIAGGLSVAPEDPAAPLRRPDPLKSDDYIYTEPFIRPTDRQNETYEYWVLKGDTPVSLNMFAAAAESINCALEYTECEEDSVEVLPTDLNSIQFDAPLDDPQEVVEFIKKAEDFLTFHLDDKTNFGDLKEVLRGLFNAAVYWNDAKKEGKYSYHANYNFDTGEPENSNLKTLLIFFDLIKFDEDDWENTFDLLDKISGFDFGEQFAYCDIAGRAKHLSDLNKRLANMINCLFYSKWKDLFEWYSNRMQAASFNMTIRDIESQKQNCEFRAWNVFLELCAFDMSLTGNEYSFLINNTGNWEWRTFAQRGACSSPSVASCKYHPKHSPAPVAPCWLNPIDPKSPYWETPRWTAAKNFCYDPQMITILTNLHYIYNSAKNEIEGNQDQKENIKKRVRQDLDFNFSIIARAIRVFCENVLLALYKIGRVPCMKITCKENPSGGYQYRNNTAQKGDKVFRETYYCGSQVKQDRIKYDAIRIKDKDDAIDQAYGDKDHLLACREDILNLLNIANPEMHATGESPEFDEYADILGRIEDISKEVLGLLRKNAGVS